MAQGSILAVNLLTINPILHIINAKMSDNTSLPAVQRLSERQAKRMTFSLSPPNNKIGLVKLCNRGVVDLRLIILHICAENRAALTSKDEAKNTMPPTAIILVS